MSSQSLISKFFAGGKAASKKRKLVGNNTSPTKAKRRSPYAEGANAAAAVVSTASAASITPSSPSPSPAVAEQQPPERACDRSLLSHPRLSSTTLHYIQLFATILINIKLPSAIL